MACALAQRGFDLDRRPTHVRVRAPAEVNDAFAAALADASADEKPFPPFLDALELFGGCHAWSSAFAAASFTVVSFDNDYVSSLVLSKQIVLAVAFALHLRVRVLICEGRPIIKLRGIGWS